MFTNLAIVNGGPTLYLNKFYDSTCEFEVHDFPWSPAITGNQTLRDRENPMKIHHLVR